MVSASVSRVAALGDVALAPRSLGAMGLGLPGQYLPGYTSPPINGRRLLNEVEFMCSQVATTERLLHEALGSVHRSILRPVCVSLGKEARLKSVFQ
jgi:hypothetical protein